MRDIPPFRPFCLWPSLQISLWTKVWLGHVSNMEDSHVLKDLRHRDLATWKMLTWRPPAALQGHLQAWPEGTGYQHWHLHVTDVPGGRRCGRVSLCTKTPWCSRQRKRELAESLGPGQTGQPRLSAVHSVAKTVTPTSGFAATADSVLNSSTSGTTPVAPPSQTPTKIKPSIKDHHSFRTTSAWFFRGWS